MQSPLMMKPMRLLARVLLALATAPALLAGCGGSGASSTTTTRTAPSTRASASTVASFAWLHPGPAPRGWSVARLPDNAALTYPSSWHRVRSDPESVSAVRSDSRSGLIEEYLNATPQQGEETLQNWATFRPSHNQEEGDSHIQVVAAARDLRFRNGQGSCVIDRYRTSRTTYEELACLVRGPHGANVIVAAAQAERWTQSAPGLEQAVSAFVT